jgi:hypothetical protein
VKEVKKEGRISRQAGRKEKYQGRNDIKEGRKEERISRKKGRKDIKEERK